MRAIYEFQCRNGLNRDIKNVYILKIVSNRLMNKKKIVFSGNRVFLGNNFIKDYDHIYDIKSFSFLQDTFESLDLKGIDTVVHLAALVHQMGGASKEAYFTTNVDNNTMSYSLLDFIPFDY